MRSHTCSARAKRCGISSAAGRIALYAKPLTYCISNDSKSVPKYAMNSRVPRRNGSGCISAQYRVTGRGKCTGSKFHDPGPGGSK